MIYVNQASVPYTARLQNIWAITIGPSKRRMLYLESSMPVEYKNGHSMTGYRWRFLDSGEMDFPQYTDNTTIGKVDKLIIENKEIHATFEECLSWVFGLNYTLIASDSIENLCVEYISILGPRTPKGIDDVIENLEDSLTSLKTERVLNVLVS